MGGMAAARGVLGGEGKGVLRGVVIGHSGRGDYGHGLETIFEGRAGVEVVGVADPDVRRGEAVARRIGARRAYGDWREMVAAERPQVASLAMRHADQHHEIGLGLLRAGCHVYCEKPFTRDAAEADALLVEAERRGLKVAVAHTMRMTPPVVAARRFLAEGGLGEVIQLRAHGKQDGRAGGEDMMVLGTHLFDLMLAVAGRPEFCAARVLAGGRPVGRGDRRETRDNVGWVAGDQVFAHFGFGKGVEGTFTSSAGLRETLGPWGLEILGSKGAMRILCDIEPRVFTRGAASWSGKGGKGGEGGWRPLEGVPEGFPPHNAAPVEDWLRCVANGGEPECGGRNGALAVEMAMGVYAAALAGGRVEFPLVERGHPLA